MNDVPTRQRAGAVQGPTQPHLNSRPVTTKVSEIVFAVEPWAPTRTLLTPFVDGRSFGEMVTEYEESHGWEDAGIHEGLVVGGEQLQDLPRYLLDGQSLEQFGATGTVLLGCTCGTIDDGPFFGTLLVTDNQVTRLEIQESDGCRPWLGLLRPRTVRL